MHQVFDVARLDCGLRFCEIADSFLGFKPRSNAIEMKFRAQQQIINDAAAMRIQTHYRGYLTRKAWLEVLEHQRRMRAAMNTWAAHGREQPMGGQWFQGPLSSKGAQQI